MPGLPAGTSPIKSGVVDWHEIDLLELPPVPGRVVIARITFYPSVPSAGYTVTLRVREGTVNIQDAIAWFDELAARVPRVRGGSSYDSEFDIQEATQWATSAQAALDSVFVPGSTVMKRWDAALRKTNEGNAWALANTQHFKAVIAVFESAREQAKAGRLKSVLVTVRAETVSELVDQAETLNWSGAVAAAAVIAGGALETHLLHLCTQNNITWAGDGSINKYNDAIAQARNARNAEVYSAADTAMIKGWALRNDAAHKPTEFKRGAEEMRLMIDGIRQFVARTT